MIESLLWHINNFIASEKFFYIPISSLISFCLAIIFILIAMPILRKCGMVDIPSTRRAHKIPTPRGGGIAFVLAYITTLYFIGSSSAQYFNSSYLLLGVSILALVSFIDDARGMGISIRLLTHFLVSYLCLSNYLIPNLIFRGEISPVFDMALTVFALVSFLNIYNFLDGIDGISSMQSIHLSLTTLFLCIIRDKVIINVDLVFYSSAILLGCSAAFLIFNWSPAKLFMGDVGSTFLGITHGLNLLIIASSSERLFIAAAISSLYYIADGGITILLRMMRKEKFWLPHLNHFFQQAVRKGMTHREIVWKITACNSLLLVLSVASLYVPHISIIFSILTVTYTLAHFHHGKSHS